ncbi:PolC-type DNA polymerase III [Pseudomonas sp. GCM10022188]|uniref:3'-5' exonuclease n=1 Tax=Pseudomonas TaxID=286 RepID=UPI001E384392|nr:3'-5' exonuclease [Pseudomonas oryzagri]MCC6074110.1 3'-5' exonuclease [Pseudomonas oryzagri]
MNPFAFLSALLGRGPQLDDEQRRRLQRLASPPPLDGRPLQTQRFVVLDLETSGLNVERDIVLSIGAVLIEDGAIDFGRQFECTLQRQLKTVTESVLIHGIPPSALARGVAPAEALLQLMEFAGDCVFLAYHAPFDQRMLTRALKTELGYRLQHPFFDIADLAPMLFPEAFVQRGGLDHWIDYFKLSMAQRHHASADALATAEIALILFNRARRMELDNVYQLSQRLAHWHRSRSAAQHAL